jgi:hypothetical protein
LKTAGILNITACFSHRFEQLDQGTLGEETVSPTPHWLRPEAHEFSNQRSIARYKK